MAKIVECEDGAVMRGDTDDELWEAAQQHLREAHPDLVGKVTREDILAQAKVVA
jgi:hypothetical protein